MGAIKGYVVRGTAPGDVLHEEARDTLHAAVSTWTALVMNEAARPRIFAVAEDGTETPLPSYEEALGEIERLRADVAGMRAGLLDAAGQSRRLGAVIADPLSALEGVLHWRSFAFTIGCGAQGPNEGATTVIEHVTCTACLSAYTHNDYPAASLPTVADVEPIAAAMTAAPPSIREPAEPDDRGPARAWGTWQAPPRRRRNIGREARIATGSGHKLHLKIDLDDSGAPCAIKAEVHKEGSVFRGMLDTICALASQGLQHGASIHEVASRLIGVRFEPDGAVEGHATVRECLSIVDLLGRMIEAEFPRDGGAP